MDGILHSESGDIRRFSCKMCGKGFTKNLDFEHMRARPEAIAMRCNDLASLASLLAMQRRL
jgi:hypothetical protein